MALLAMSCAPAAQPVSDKLGVMVTVLPQVEFVEAVGGDRVEAAAMVPPGANPHTYEVTPAQMARLGRAKLYIKVGSPLQFETTWMDKLAAQNSGMKIVDSGKGIALMESADPDEPGSDPHTWTSPRNVKTMANNICEALAQADPAGRTYYEKNRDDYLQKLDRLDSDIATALEGEQGRSFIVYHPAWGYFARDYGLEQLGIEREGKEPQAAYMARLIGEARDKNIKVIFVSPQFDTRSAEAIAREINGKVVSIDPEARDYLDNMRRVADAFREALQGR
jgi:zinc transport system substrate-binding protein